MIVEVFKTNVTHPKHATLIVDELKKTFPQYSANFDLADCDNILRVEVATGRVDTAGLINKLAGLGFGAEVLPDHIPEHL